ncbi:pyruvate dehydrogenase (acetyl-transferring) E1 component subunit alpha [Baekduia soli]|uniref:Pyruvate dehydrogenase (Acetyl-transferring) E1 component subunit alpha n=1 Tax=Baekduia soli TaxID=496014 RepID=A0A5B8U1N5_9ACTN|nr:thiamine pyrophosphate-dependent enzyme [Baekduia soli]QEC46949.1 pyruvate dehydrogenase (acetyl-transferring) E1 component subunit alpha [Baekduia soli]
MDDRALPDADVAREWLAAMLLIRRFEERASELYAEGRIGGFLHLAIGEEAVIVGSVRALRATDWLASTYRAHGHALARGTEPERVMAELLGRTGGVSGGRGGSMHMADVARRFMGGFGIVGGHLPIAAGFALSANVRGSDEASLCHFGDGAANHGTFTETLNLAALWSLPVVFLATNNRMTADGPAERHASATDLLVRAESLGVRGRRCDGMDVADTHAVLSEALAVARDERHPVLVEAMTTRFRGHSAADRAEDRTPEQEARWRRTDPVVAFGDRLVAEGVLAEEARAGLQDSVADRVQAAVSAALASPPPDPSTLADHVPAPWAVGS